MPNYQAILFDLDGTLLDTAPDLANALNHVLVAENLSPLSFAKIRPVASDGARGLLQLGFNIDESHPQYEIWRQRLLTYYAAHIADNTTLFPEIETIITHLERVNIPWGIVTNKPTTLTLSLLEQLNLRQRAGCIVCGDTLPQRKPHPAPLLHAAAQLNVLASACCYVGDAERDIQAARAANMNSVAALYGYLHHDCYPEQWQADYYIETPLALLDII